MQTEKPIDVLVRFGRLASEAAAPADILAILVDTALAQVPVPGAAVVRIMDSGRLEIAAAGGLCSALTGLALEADTLGPELEAELLSACGSEGRTLEIPLVSAGGLFGALILIGAPGFVLEGEAREMSQGLADMAAVSLDRTTRYAELARSYVELRASREALAQAEKLRALGQMAAGISHDLKNILNPLGLQLQLVKRRIRRDPAAAEEAATRMEEVIRHGVEVVERLRAFSRHAPEQAESVSLDDLMVTSVALSRPRLEMTPRIRLVSEPGESVPVMARSSELVSALVNLIINSIEAFGENPGVITVRTGSDAGGGWIEVEDDGPGMPDDVRLRIFEPFFTTKADGTGLGLAMVYAFVERQRGTVTLDSELGRGTRLRLWFPAAA